MFIDDYEREKQKLLSDPKCEKLLARHGSRDIAVHRKQLPKKVALSAYVHIAVTAYVVAKDEKGNVIGTGGSQPRPVEVHPPEIKYYLSDWPNDDIPALCEYTLNEVKKFVGTLRSKYT